jgi:hypothetical protein
MRAALQRLNNYSLGDQSVVFMILNNNGRYNTKNYHIVAG